MANVSHELKTPLALIRLFAETLELGRVPSEEKAQQYYRVINKESQRLTQLINNILDFSRIEAGRKEYRFAPTDVARGGARRDRGLPLPDRAAGLRAGGGRRPTTCRRCPRTRRRWGRPSSTSSTTRSSTRASQVIHIEVRRDGAAGPRLGDRPRDRHPARASRRRSSRSSTAPRTAWCTRPRAAASAWPSSGTSWRRTAERWRSRARPGKGSTFTLVLPVASEAA